MFQGSIVAIVTPMNPDGSIDIVSFKNLLDFHIENKTDGVVVLGTTGECPTIDFDEHTFLIEEAVKHINGKIPVIAGTGANSTNEAVFLTQSAKETGADARRGCLGSQFFITDSLLYSSSATGRIIKLIHAIYA